MTRAPDVSRLRFSDLADALVEMRRRGLRVSAPRRLVLQELFAADEPCPAEHLARALDLDLASVYRILDTLERHGLAQHVHLGHGPGLYALVGHGEHEYLCCERCGAVRTVAPQELDSLREAVRDRFGYLARFTHHAIVGTCPACAIEDPGSAASVPASQPHAGPEHDRVDDAHEHIHVAQR